jgi:hypothetical protein
MTSTTSNWDALEARLNNVKKPVQTFKLCDDPDVRDRYVNAKRAAEEVDAYLQQVKGQADPEALALVEKQAKDAKTELAAAKKAYDAHTVTLRFTALERQELEDLQNKHPASEQDEEKGNDFAFDTFAPALISAASMDGMPVEAASRYLNTWTSGDAAALWRAAWTVQHTQRTDLGKG